MHVLSSVHLVVAPHVPLSAATGRQEHTARSSIVLQPSSSHTFSQRTTRNKVDHLLHVTLEGTLRPWRNVSESAGRGVDDVDEKSIFVLIPFGGWRGVFHVLKLIY
jgi:hypothetical protein